MFKTLFALSQRNYYILNYSTICFVKTSDIHIELKLNHLKNIYHVVSYLLQAEDCPRPKHLRFSLNLLDSDVDD